MTIAKGKQHAAVALLAATVMLQSLANARGLNKDAVAYASTEEGIGGVRVHLDNDLFAGRQLDRDYTGGLGVTLSGAAAREGVLSLDRLLGAADAMVITVPAADVHYARQIGMIAFTPQDIVTAVPQHDDRPYASLLFTSNGRVSVEADDRDAWSSYLTIGVLGLPISQTLHRAVHDLVGSEAPQGYEFQISAGGEPTARYSLARQHLWFASPSGKVDVKTTIQGSVGYLTQASAGLSLRIGHFNTPWWSFAPELTDYMAAPLPVEQDRRPSQLYFFAGARLTARAYNAFLQGQFRESEVTYSFSQVEPLVAEAWMGFATQVFGQTELSYTLRYQTAELREGRAARDAFWGSVQLAHNF